MIFQEDITRAQAHVLYVEKKIFIEINVPSQVKKRLIQKTAAWQELPIKWLKEDNLHITVAFIGYVDESVIPDICRKINEAVNNFESFEIVFDKIDRISLYPIS